MGACGQASETKKEEKMDERQMGKETRYIGEEIFTTIKISIQ
jgi:hypothetical protein